MISNNTKFLIHISLILFIFNSFISLAFAEDGITNTEIKIGMVTAMTGKTSFLGTSFRDGVLTYINKVNDSGGVYGRTITLITKDDKYEPYQTLIEAYKLIKKDKIFCFLGHMGTPTTTALRPLLKREKTPLFATFSGGERIRNPVTKYLFNYRASYIQEAYEAVDGIVNKMGYRKIGVFYQNDYFGKTSLRGVEEALAKKGIKVLVKSTYKRNSTDIEEGLKEIMKFKPEVVFTMATYQAASRFILSAKSKGYNPIFVANSGVGTGRFLDLLGTKANGVIVTQVVPLVTSNLPAVKEYRSDFKKYLPNTKLNGVSLEGYLSAKLFIEGLKKTGKNITRELLISTLEDMKNIDIGIGIKLSYSKDNHQASNVIYDTYIKDGEYKNISNWNDSKNKTITH